MAYDDGRFGVVERQWFGLNQKHGGSGSAITFNETEANKVTRWYPRGPIHIEKFGVKTLTALGKGEELFTLQIDGTTAMKKITASTTSAAYTVASAAVNDDLAAGSYLTILASTNVCSTGSVALFIDFRRKYSGSRHSPLQTNS
jgi:hypothetical protein